MLIWKLQEHFQGCRLVLELALEQSFSALIGGPPSPQASMELLEKAIKDFVEENAAIEIAYQSHQEEILKSDVTTQS